MLTVEYLRKVLDYDPLTGVFKWKITRGTGAYARKDKIAGYARSKGSYWQLRLCGKHYYAHRLAWLYIYGEWPKQDLDHIDRNKQNNAIGNLREATATQNGANAKVRKDSRLGIQGVRKNRGAKTYEARVGTTYLGCFSTPEAAHEAYLRAKKERYGEFA